MKNTSILESLKKIYTKMTGKKVVKRKTETDVLSDIAENYEPVDIEPTVEVTDITNLSQDVCNSLKCGDIVVKKTEEQKHSYRVSFKKDDEGMCLTYVDASVSETVSYDLVDGTWTYNSTDTTQLGGGGGGTTYTAGNGIEITEDVISTDLSNYAKNNINIIGNSSVKIIRKPENSDDNIRISLDNTDTVFIEHDFAEYAKLLDINPDAVYDANEIYYVYDGATKSYTVRAVTSSNFIILKSRLYITTSKYNYFKKAPSDEVYDSTKAYFRDSSNSYDAVLSENSFNNAKQNDRLYIYGNMKLSTATVYNPLKQYFYFSSKYFHRIYTETQFENCLANDNLYEPLYDYIGFPKATGTVVLESELNKYRHTITLILSPATTGDNISIYPWFTFVIETNDDTPITSKDDLITALNNKYGNTIKTLLASGNVDFYSPSSPGYNKPITCIKIDNTNSRFLIPFFNFNLDSQDEAIGLYTNIYNPSDSVEQIF